MLPVLYRIVLEHLINNNSWNRFDSSGKGFITEKDFVSGWKNEIMERSNNTDVMKKVVRS